MVQMCTKQLVLLSLYRKLLETICLQIIQIISYLKPYNCSEKLTSVLNKSWHAVQESKNLIY